MEDAGNPHRGFLDKMKKFFNRNSEDVTEEDIKAKFCDGVLMLTIPKKEAKPEVPEKKFISIEG